MMIEQEKLRTPAIASQETIGTFLSAPNRRRLSRYGPLILWAALIFVGSSDLFSASHTSALLVKPLRWLFPNASDATLAVIHFLIRKAAHFSEYAVFAWLAARAFRASSHALLRDRWFWISLLLVIVYSLSDEFHQTFVPSRTASIYDSMIDSAGGLAALALTAVRSRNKN
jgi:VanZ family protein